MTVGVPIGGAIGAMTPGVGGLMAASSFAFGWWLVLTSLKSLGARVVFISLTLCALAFIAVALYQATKAYR